jgi:hypothetical protein
MRRSNSWRREFAEPAAMLQRPDSRVRRDSAVRLLEAGTASR